MSGVDKKIQKIIDDAFFEGDVERKRALAQQGAKKPVKKTEGAGKFSKWAKRTKL